MSASLRTVGQRISSIYSGPRGQADGFAYYTVGAYAEYRLLRQLKLFVDLNNLSNQLDFDMPVFVSRKFNCMAGISVHL